METNQNPQVSPTLTIPTLDSQPIVAPSFAAFKSEEQISFVRPYDPKATVVEGFRHSVIRYRNTDKKSVERPAKMVTIPQVTLGDDYLMPEDAAKVFIGCIEDEQDAIMRSLIDTGASVIHWEKLTLAATLASLTALRVSNRLDKASIEAWAMKALADVCNARADEISATKGYDEANKLKQRAGTLNAYVGIAAKLAAPVPNIGTEQAQALLAMMKRANLADDIAQVVNKKLDAILNPKVLDLAGDL